jgi:hypothetical protein
VRQQDDLVFSICTGGMHAVRSGTVRPTTLSYDKLGMKANSGTRGWLGGATKPAPPFARRAKLPLFLFVYNLNSTMLMKVQLVQPSWAFLGVFPIPGMWFLIIGADQNLGPTMPRQMLHHLSHDTRRDIWKHRQHRIKE